jgi:hypothetical protein
MRPTRQALIIGSAVWAVVGALVAISAVPDVNPDARWLVGVASVIFPAAAAAAAVALRRGALRWAGVLLLISVATPTYFAWALNLPALVAGLGLTLAPSSLDRSPGPTRA